MQASRAPGNAVYLHGIGHFHPTNVIDGGFLEALDIGTSARWIDEKLGIRERRTVLDLDYIRTTRNRDLRAADEASAFTNAETAERAANMALERAGLKASDIGTVFSGSSSQRHLAPPEACLVSYRLGLTVPAFDVCANCNTFLSQASLIAGMGTNAPADFYLLIQVENMTRHISYDERSTASLMGDATTAVIASTTVPSKVKLTGISLGTNPSLWEHAVVTIGSHFRQNGQAVKQFATETMLAGVRRNPNPEAFSYVFHQTNFRLLQKLIELAGIPEERHLYNADRFGNCAGAGSVSVLSEAWDRLQAESLRINLSVVGGGLSWGNAIIDS